MPVLRDELESLRHDNNTVVQRLEPEVESDSTTIDEEPYRQNEVKDIVKELGDFRSQIGRLILYGMQNSKVPKLMFAEQSKKNAEFFETFLFDVLRRFYSVLYGDEYILQANVENRKELLDRFAKEFRPFLLKLSLKDWSKFTEKEISFLIALLKSVSYEDIGVLIDPTLQANRIKLIQSEPANLEHTTKNPFSDWDTTDMHEDTANVIKSFQEIDQKRLDAIVQLTQLLQ